MYIQYILYNNFVWKTSNTRHTINNENVICPAIGCQKKAGTPATAGVVTSKTTVTAVMPEISKSPCSFNASKGKPVGAGMVDKLTPQSTELTRGPPELVQHFRL
jgi:hypothetical protein